MKLIIYNKWLYYNHNILHKEIWSQTGKVQSHKIWAVIGLFAIEAVKSILLKYICYFNVYIFVFYFYLKLNEDLFSFNILSKNRKF